MLLKRVKVPGEADALKQTWEPLDMLPLLIIGEICPVPYSISLTLLAPGLMDFPVLDLLKAQRSGQQTAAGAWHCAALSSNPEPTPQLLHYNPN